jgi:hypothetical protein
MNFVAFVVFINHLRGPLAKSIQLRGSFLDAFTDIGSEQAQRLLAAKLQRAQGDLAAIQLRGEVDASVALPESGRLVLSREDVRAAVKDAVVEVLTALRLQPEAAQVNINSSARHNSDLRAINVPVPKSEEEADALADETLLVTTYLRQQFATTELDELVQRQAVAAFKSRFSSTLKDYKMEVMEAAGEEMPVVGQIGRAQPHYVKGDRDLMDEVWERLQVERRQVVRKVQARLAEWAARTAAAGLSMQSSRSRSRRACHGSSA